MYGDGSECKEYSGYEKDWFNGRWCYADVETCLDAKEHAGNGSSYGASRAACIIGIYVCIPIIIEK